MENCISIAPENESVEVDVVHELPCEEALVRLYELVDRFSAGSRPACPVAEAHHLPPHAFDFGCCIRATARLVLAG